MFNASAVRMAFQKAKRDILVLRDWVLYLDSDRRELTERVEKLEKKLERIERRNLTWY